MTYRCSECMRIFEDALDLYLSMDGPDYVYVCPYCGTDGYIEDLEESE